MQERTLGWKVGQEVILPKVEPYKIVQLVGKAGNIQIGENGRWHVFWRSEARNPENLVHHGGSNGFSDIAAVRHQHERVILQYTGVSIKLEPEDVVISGQLKLPQIADIVQTIDVPGEQQTVNRWVNILQNAIRDIPQVRDNRQLELVKTNLEELIFKTNLGRALNTYKKAAHSALLTGLQGGRAKLLEGVTAADRLFLLRAHETLSIVVNTMGRVDDLDKLQTRWNNTVLYLPYMYGRVVKNLERGIWDDYLERTINAEIFDEQIGAFARLEKLRGEPYLSRAQKFIQGKNPVTKLWEERNSASLLEFLRRQTGEAEIWKRYIDDEMRGVDFGKYALS